MKQNRWVGLLNGASQESTTDEILKRAKELAALTREGELAKISSGLKWRRPLKVRKSHYHAFVGVRDLGQAPLNPSEVMRTNS